MSQQALFAIELVDEIDEPFFAGRAKQASLIGVDAGDNEYVLKTIQEGAMVPITEWICHHLCRLIGIQTPEFSAVKRMNGQHAFGSKIDYNLVDFNRPPLLSNPQKVAIIKEAADSESATIALDTPLGNIDRHFGNWLYTVRRNRHIALAIDFGMTAAFRSPVFANFAWPPGCKSAEMLSDLKALNAFHISPFKATLTELGKVPDSDLKAIISTAPPLWLVHLDENAILTWWRTYLSRRLIDSENFIMT